MIEELTSRVLQARDVAHRLHWRSNTYALHMILNTFYDDVLDAVDELVECHSGEHGLIENFEVQTKPVKDITAYLSEESEWIQSNRDKISEGSDAIGALVDVLVNTYQRTIYKLENLT